MNKAALDESSKRFADLNRLREHPEPVIVRCNHCMHMVKPEHFEASPEDQRCPRCQMSDALMDLTIDDIIAQNNARYGYPPDEGGAMKHWTYTHERTTA